MNVLEAVQTAETWPVFPFLLYSVGRQEYLSRFSSVFIHLWFSSAIHVYPLGSKSTTGIIWPSTTDFTGMTPTPAFVDWLCTDFFFLLKQFLHRFLPLTEAVSNLKVATFGWFVLVVFWVFLIIIIKNVLSYLIEPSSLHTVSAAKVNMPGFASRCEHLDWGHQGRILQHYKLHTAISVKKANDFRWIQLIPYQLNSQLLLKARTYSLQMKSILVLWSDQLGMCCRGKNKIFHTKV